MPRTIHRESVVKVLHICQRDDPATGGAARVAIELAKSLPAHGVESACVFVYGKSGPFSEELPGRTFHLGLKSSREAWRGIGRLRSLIVDGDWDIVHHHDGLIWTHWVSGTLGKRTVVGHGHLPPPPAACGWRIRLAHRIQSRRYDHLFAVSAKTRDDWIAQGFPAEKTSVVSNGVDLTRFRPATEAERTRVRERWQLDEAMKAVGFVGRLDSEMKGCREFIDLVATLGTPFVGIMAGDGPDRSALEEYARRLGIEDRVIFTGIVDPARSVYPGLDAFALTSRYEPFGLVLLEAAASGIPIAMLPADGGAVDLGCRLEAVILEDRTIPPLAEAVRRLALKESPERVRTCEELLADFSWDRTAARIAATYSKLLRAENTAPTRA